ncbi:unnamed protein product, partial [Brenthis ino]
MFELKKKHQIECHVSTHRPCQYVSVSEMAYLYNLKSCNVYVLWAAWVVCAASVPALGLRCYSCSSLQTRACAASPPALGLLRECPAAPAFSAVPPGPVCRVVSQAQRLGGGGGSGEAVVVRECAYVWEAPLRCTRSQLGALHYSTACECATDACNATPTTTTTTTTALVTCFVVNVLHRT